MFLVISTPAIVFISIGVLFFILISFMLIRTLVLKVVTHNDSEIDMPDIDADSLTQKLSDAVKFPTITMIDNIGDGTVFLEYQKFLEKSYPKIMEKAEKVNFNKFSVSYIYRGTKKDLLPIAILAHQDVVPADEEGWEVEPFSGAIKDGFVYGRGSQDMKSQMIAALEGFELLLKRGIEIERTVYFCFGHDEERKGLYGNKAMVEQFIKDGIRFEFVIDEGGTIMDGSPLGIDKQIALIGTCEKGYADVIIEYEKPSGHASTPSRKTAIGSLGKALYKIEKKQMRPLWSEPVKDMFDTLAPHMIFPMRFAIANKDILSPLLLPALTLISPFTACLVKTTFAPTQLFGSDSPNTLPSKAKASINCRLITGNTIDDLTNHIKKRAKGATVTVDSGYTNPSLISDPNAPQYEVVAKSIRQTFEGCVVSPYVFIATSDSKFYHQVSDNVYRFTPFLKNVDDANRIHGVNERQDIEMLIKGTEFFYKLYVNALTNQS